MGSTSHGLEQAQTCNASRCRACSTPGQPATARAWLLGTHGIQACCLSKHALWQRKLPWPPKT